MNIISNNSKLYKDNVRWSILEFYETMVEQQLKVTQNIR